MPVKSYATHFEDRCDVANSSASARTLDGYEVRTLMGEDAAGES
jgi:hypothetical protein